MREVIREYAMSYSELRFLVGDFVVYMNRDATEYAAIPSFYFHRSSFL